MIPEGRRRAELLRIAGAMRRVGETGEEILAALTATNVARCVPPLPSAELEALARDVAHRYSPAVPSPLADRNGALPAWPAGVVPAWLAEVVAAYAAATDATMEMATVPALAVLAAALGAPWRVDARGMVRAPRLWLVLVAPPGAGKTPTAAPLMAPMLAADRAAREEHRAAARAHRSALAAWAAAGRRRGVIEPEEPAIRRVDELFRGWRGEAVALDEAGAGLRAGARGKAADHLVRLTALIHGADRLGVALTAGEALTPAPVPAATVERAAALVDYFLAHGDAVAERVLARDDEDGEPMDTDDDLAGALQRAVPAGAEVEDTPAGWAARVGWG
ncbi:MAG: DUF3987 domain-containing protein, partial [Planctomycetes bacterium]|nr:DUF3987 domain-containing protein [Planctomycetota bacterium]